VPGDDPPMEQDCSGVLGPLVSVLHPHRPLWGPLDLLHGMGNLRHNLTQVIRTEVLMGFLSVPHDFAVMVGTGLFTGEKDNSGHMGHCGYQGCWEDVESAKGPSRHGVEPC
jgi:hypothetical protein